MSSPRTALSMSAPVVAGLCGVAALFAPAAVPVVAQTVVPIAKLSLAQRLQSAPGGTVVLVGSRTTTLAALRAAHRARELALARAGSVGAIVASKNIPLRGGTHPIASAVNPATLQTVPQPVVEPASQYASAPADMRAFCAAAHASACLYLPPNQQVSVQPTYVSLWDSLITQQQCAQEDGSWDGMWNSWFCAFAYPNNVTVNFTPAADFKLTQSATCDATTFAYTVDPHGAVNIRVTLAPVIMTTHPGTFCAVTVTPDG